MLRLGERGATSSICFAAWKGDRKTAGNAHFFHWDLSGTSHLNRTVQLYLGKGKGWLAGRWKVHEGSLSAAEQFAGCSILGEGTQKVWGRCGSSLMAESIPAGQLQQSSWQSEPWAEQKQRGILLFLSFFYDFYFCITVGFQCSINIYV